jgi:hypothetical protein
MPRMIFGRDRFVFVYCAIIGLLFAPSSRADTAFQIKLDAEHPWRPPFGLERIGGPVSIVIDAAARPEPDTYAVTAFWKGKNVGRQTIAFPDKGPYSARVAIDGAPSVDEIVLTAQKPNGPSPLELARQSVRLPDFEADATARADRTVNPVDLGTILVPSGWLLLGPGQTARLELAVLSRARDLPRAKIKGWYASTPEQVVISTIDLRAGTRAQLEIALSEPKQMRDRDELSIAFEDESGQALWRKTIPVMLVREPPRHPPFGATYERLRYDAPISVRQPGMGTFSTLSYAKGWKPELRDVVIWLPNGGRFVFWRGSSFIPFWAGPNNTGACYEWAEIVSQPAGAVDCVEPLMDKELRYGSVEIVESTMARVHVRWTYQSTDFEYKVWGDQAVEDYYFYPDGFGTRVVNLKADPQNDYELCEFIILTPQGAYPLDVLAENPVDALYLSGRVHQVRLPGPLSKAGESAAKLPGGEPALYRVRLSKRDALAAICFSTQEIADPPFVFGPFFDSGLLVTPCYWGSHWPLARGNSTGNKIDDRIAFTPCHNSVMSWGNRRPEPLETAKRITLDGLGRSRLMTFRRWAWLIGMTELGDDQLLELARSYAQPPAIEVRGGSLDFQGYSPETRAIRVAVSEPEVRLMLKPSKPCVNPVFELVSAPRGGIKVSLANDNLPERRYAWDGHTLWLDATVKAPTELRVSFDRAQAEHPERSR